MAEPQSSITPDFLQRRFGPLSFLGWMGVLAGTGLVYYIYKRYQADQTTAATTAATTTSQPIDTANTGTGTTSGTAPTASTTTYPDVGSWLDAVITGLEGQGVDGATAYNAGLSWINGNCVSSKVYTALGQVIPTVGLPPGYGSASPVLSVCPDTPVAPAPPNAPTPPTPGEPTSPVQPNPPPVPTAPAPPPTTTRGGTSTVKAPTSGGGVTRTPTKQNPTKTYPVQVRPAPVG
jgi:hypothetical protein